MNTKANPYVLLFWLVCLCGASFCTFSCKSGAKTSQNDTNKTTNKGPSDELKFKTTFYNACKEKINGNMEIALGLFHECLKINAKAPEPKYELAFIYRNNSQFDQALVLAKEAAEARPTNEWFQLLYIDCLHNKRKFSEACSNYEKLISAFPEKEDYYHELASEYLYADKPEKSLKVFDDIKAKFGPTEEIYLNKSKILKELKRYDAAEKELKELIRQFPMEPEYHTYLAEIYQESNQIEKALQTYQEILKVYPDNPYIRLALADYYRLTKNDSLFFEQMRIAFKSKDLGIDSKVKILVSLYGLTETNPQYLKQAYSLCDELIRTNPDEAKSYSVYGDYLYRDKKFVEAQKAFVKVVEIDNSKYAIWNLLLICDAELNDYSALSKHSEEAMELFPNQATPYYMNGLANTKLNNYKKAIESFKDGQEFLYDNLALHVQFLSSLGEAYYYNKDYELSDKSLDEALSIDKDNQVVLNNYSYFLAMRGDKLVQAEQMIKRALELNPLSLSYLDTYAWVLFKKTNYSEAKSVLEKALLSGGDKRATILEHYGDVLFKLNDPEKALDYWGKALTAGGKSELLIKKINGKKYYDE